MSYLKEITLERKFAQKVKQILGEHFICQDHIADTQEGTDFLVLSLKPVRVGLRLRRFKQIQYSDEFTLRYEMYSGARTEIHKIKDGLVDYIMYGFLDKNEENIIKYFIGDLNVFRAECDGIKPTIISNRSKYDSKFAAYKISSFSESFILKNYEDLISIELEKI